MRTRRTITISLPPEMAEQVESAMKAEHRTRSELVREALRTYISIRLLPQESPTSSELRAIRRGEAAYRRGDYITLDEYFRELDRRPRRARKKGS
jgi:predicted transcriptional regulator